MKNLLLKTKRRLLTAFLVAIALVGFTTGVQAQTITENFEEDAWVTGAAASTYTVSMTGYGTANCTYGTGTWKINAGFVATTNRGGTNKYIQEAGTSAAYLVTPIIQNGVTQVSMMLMGSNSGTTFGIYAATNTTFLTNTASVCATGAPWTEITSFTMQHSSLSWFSTSVSITNAARSNPVILKFARKGTGNPKIDDIVITSPLSCTSVTSFNVGGGTTICSGSSTDVTLSGSTSGVTYQLLKGGVAEGGTTAGTGSGLSWSVSTAGTYTVKTTTAGGFCETVMTGSAVIAVSNAPTTAAAGTDQSKIEGEVATLAANTPSTGTGAWSIVSGPSTNTSQISSLSSPTATFTPDGGVGDYTLRWTISNSPCTASTDDVIITYAAASNPTLSLTSAGGTDAQSIPANIAITNIVYTWGGTATTADVTWTGTASSSTPPTGISVDNSGPVTISGTPSVAGNYGYTVTTDGGTPAEKTGTITVGLPSITACAGPYTFSAAGWAATAAQTCTTVNGSNLTADISVSVDAPFQVSNNNSTWGTTTSIARTGYSVTNATLWVRYNPSSADAHSGTVSFNSTGATQQSYSVSGTVTPNAATALTVAKKSDIVQYLTWTAPANGSDGVLVFAQAATDVTYTPSGAGSGYTDANADIASAGVHGSDLLVYAGTGTSVEVTGLSTATTYYYKVYNYIDDSYSAAASVNGATAVQPTTALAASTADVSSVLTWTNPAYNVTQTNYWDEVLVVAKSGSAVDGTPSGDGTAYTADAAFGVGTEIGTGNFVVYKGTGVTQTVTGLTNGTAYHYATFVRHGSVWSVAQTANATPSQFTVGDFGSVASNTWATFATTWRRWDGSGWNTIPTAVPSNNDNVWILNGNQVLAAAAGNCKNLHVINGQLLKSTTSGTVKAPVNITVAGSSGTGIIEVGPSGQIGNGLEDDLADGISINLANSNTTTITGGGRIDLSKLIYNGNNSTCIIDTDVKIHYHGSSNTGNASALYPATTPTTLTINAGKTLTMARWSSIYSSSSSNTLQNFNFTINVNGTLTFEIGSPTDVNDRTLAKGYMSMNANSGYTFALNIGAAGTANINELYPNGGPTGSIGSISTITVAAGGVLNIGYLADFSKVATQAITGGGAVNVLSGATLKIADTAGANGPIQTTGSNTLSTSASYNFSGVAEQVTGASLPATVVNLTNSNAAGLKLSANTEVTGTLNNSGKLIFISDDSGTKQLKLTNAGTNTGTIVLRKAFTASKGWYFMSFPFDVTAANIKNTLDQTQATWGALGTSDGGFYVAEYDGYQRDQAGTYYATNSAYWKDVKTAGTLLANKGYIIAVETDMTLDFVSSANPGGSLFATTYDKAISTYTANANTAHNSWNMVGIPFSSAFDLLNATQDQAPFYYFDATTSTYAAVMADDSYQTYPFTSFFVQSKPLSATPTNINFASAGRVLKSAAAPSISEIGLVVKNAKYADKLRIRLQDGAKKGFELDKDAVKFFSPKAEVPQIFCKENGQDLSVTALPENTTKVEVSVKIGEDGTYTISLADIAKAAGCSQVILEDGDTQTDLLAAGSYSFTGTAGSTKSVSVLLYPTGTTIVNAEGAAIVVKAAAGKAYISGLQGAATVNVYDVAGKLVQSFTNVTNDQALTLKAKGVCIIDVNTATQTGKAKVSVE